MSGLTRGPGPWARTRVPRGLLPLSPWGPRPGGSLSKSAVEADGGGLALCVVQRSLAWKCVVGFPGLRISDSVREAFLVWLEGWLSLSFGRLDRALVHVSQWTCAGRPSVALRYHQS